MVTMSGASEAIHTGYLTKHGAVVKNWKLRYMVLLKNGAVPHSMDLLL